MILFRHKTLESEKKGIVQQPITFHLSSEKLSFSSQDAKFNICGFFSSMRDYVKYIDIKKFKCADNFMHMHLATKQWIFIICLNIARHHTKNQD